MSAGFVFWFLMLLCVLFGLWSVWPLGAHVLPAAGNSLLLLILLALLGWRVFGPPIQR